MKQRKKEDFFNQKWQMNARIEGKYDEIAKGVKKCVFCDLKEKYIIARHQGLVLTVNLFPYTDGHLLIIPERHVESFFDLTEKEILAYFYLAKRGIKLLKKALNLKDFWLLLREGERVGKTVEHFHWQIIPYFKGLVSWHYQKIKISPLKLAKIFKENE